MADAKKKPTIVGKGNSPEGIAVFPALTTPDTKFAKNGIGVYKTGLKLPADHPFVEKVREMHEAACKAARKELEEKNADLPKPKQVNLAKVIDSDPPMKDDVDTEGNPTGNVIINFKANAGYIDKKTEQVKPLRMPLFDAKGKPVKGIDVWGGSRIAVNYEALPYYVASSKSVGVSLRLNAVQVIELRNGQAKDAAAFGFGSHDEGFDSSGGGEEGTFPAAGGDTPAEDGDEF